MARKEPVPGPSFLDLTLPTLAENLALDEALLDEAEAGGLDEVLRLWEAPQLAVILGRSSLRTREARVAACDADGVPILRRCSGGCAVVIGPGCLMYSLVLGYERREQLHLIEEAHRFVLGRIQQALSRQIDGVSFQGTSDLALHGRKFSGNSLRCKRSHLLYHGTLLYDFPLQRIERCLAAPPRQPDYRAGRGHADFVTNLPLTATALRAALQTAFDATMRLTDWPAARTGQLLAARYGRSEWHAER